MFYFFVIATLLIPFITNIFSQKKHNNSILNILIFISVAQVSIFILPIGVFYSYIISILVFSLVAVYWIIMLINQNRGVINKDLVILRIKQNIHILIFGVLILALIIFGVFVENGFDTDNYLYLQISKHYESAFSSNYFVDFANKNNSPFINSSDIATSSYQIVGLFMYQGFSYNIAEMINWTKVYIPFLLFFLSYLSGWKIINHFLINTNYKIIVLYNIFWTIILIFLLFNPSYSIFITLWSSPNLEISFFSIILICLGVMEKRTNFYYFTILLFLSFLSSTFTIFSLFVLIYMFFNNLFFCNKISDWIDFGFVALFTCCLLMPLFFGWVAAYIFTYVCICLYLAYYFYIKNKLKVNIFNKWKCPNLFQQKCENFATNITNKKKNLSISIVSIAFMSLSTIIYNNFNSYNILMLEVTIPTLIFYVFFFIIINFTKNAEFLRKHYLLINITMFIFFLVYLAMYLITNNLGIGIDGFWSFWRIITFYPQQHAYSMPSAGLMINCLIFICLIMLNINDKFFKKYGLGIKEKLHGYLNCKISKNFSIKQRKIILNAALTTVYLVPFLTIVICSSDYYPYLRSNYLNGYASFHDIGTMQEKIKLIYNMKNTKLSMIGSVNPTWIFDNYITGEYIGQMYNYRSKSYNAGDSISPLIANKDPYNTSRVMQRAFFDYCKKNNILFENTSFALNHEIYVKVMSYYDFIMMDESQTEFLQHFPTIDAFEKVQQVGSFHLYVRTEYCQLWN